MEARRKTLVRATLAMVGTIIGAGVFAIPAAMKGVGILTGSVIYWLLALVMLASHLEYVEVILSDAAMRRMRLPGHAQKVLGPWAGRLALITHPLQIMGASLAYLILGGQFLSSLASRVGLPNGELGWQLIFFACGAVTVYIGLKFVARVENKLTWVLVGLLVVCAGLFAAHADGSLFWTPGNLSVLAPVGVFLFALSGLPAISEVVEIAGRDRRISPVAVAAGTLGAAFLMWLFGVFAYAASGSGLGTNAMDLANGLPSSVAWLIPAVGFLAVASCFIVLTEDLKAMLHLDIRLPKPVAWAIALGGPLILLLFVTRDFLGTVSFVGSIFGALNGLLVSFMAIRILSNVKARFAWRVIFPCLTAAVFLAVLIWRILII
jgi:amino acid permease